MAAWKAPNVLNLSRFNKESLFASEAPWGTRHRVAEHGVWNGQGRGQVKDVQKYLRKVEKNMVKRMIKSF